MSIELAVIGGTGLYRFAGLEGVERDHGDTPYGKPSGDVVVGRIDGRRVAFLARHGESHSIAPHRINYRANVWMLHRLGARRIVGVNAVGGIRKDMGPRVIAVPDQIIDYTSGRLSSFCDADGAEVKHIDFSEPYSAALRGSLVKAA
ncbi:MAG TPA: S-methyl-5'-thioadenosine phosphorylase, partial [Rhodanobacteraceae bacterium]|nr:S-methyl-5'-thioadenosine phosphorylase [Rhodanobacteraceae bacterium]